MELKKNGVSCRMSYDGQLILQCWENKIVQINEVYWEKKKNEMQENTDPILKMWVLRMTERAIKRVCFFVVKNRSKESSFPS